MDGELTFAIDWYVIIIIIITELKKKMKFDDFFFSSPILDRKFQSDGIIYCLCYYYTSASTMPFIHPNYRCSLSTESKYTLILNETE